MIYCKCFRKQIYSLIDSLARKPLTEAGRNRKARIVKKLIIGEEQTRLTLHVYDVVLSMLKEYVMLFQREVPTIHLIHDKLECMFRDFLSCFVRPELVFGKSAHELSKLIIDEQSVRIIRGILMCTLLIGFHDSYCLYSPLDVINCLLIFSLIIVI